MQTTTTPHHTNQADARLDALPLRRGQSRESQEREAQMPYMGRKNQPQNRARRTNHPKREVAPSYQTPYQ